MPQDEKTCPMCGGDGEVLIPPGKPDEKPMRIPCGRCGGSGTIPA